MDRRYVELEHEVTLSDAQAELALVNAAISDILRGASQSFGSSGRNRVFLQLKELRDQRRELELVIARAQNGIFSVAQFRNPE